MAWRLQRLGHPVVLRRLHPDVCPPSPAAIADVRWLHEFLARLAGSGFPAPRPVAAFEGISWTVYGDAIWELHTFLPGRAVGWGLTSNVVEIGALLARFHTASAPITPIRQRPIAWPLPLTPHPEMDRQLRGWLDAVNDDLVRIGHPRAARLVIHGDFTVDNVIADGPASGPTGIIDFALAYVEAPLADLGFGLWRSGRPHPDAIQIDPGRVRALVAGYHRIRALPAEAAVAIPSYMRARGLQMAIKALHRGVPEVPFLRERIQWLAAHQHLLEESVAAAASIGGPG